MHLVHVYINCCYSCAIILYMYTYSYVPHQRYTKCFCVHRICGYRQVRCSYSRMLLMKHFMYAQTHTRVVRRDRASEWVCMHVCTLTIHSRTAILSLSYTHTPDMYTCTFTRTHTHVQWHLSITTSQVSRLKEGGVLTFILKFYTLYVHVSIRTHFSSAHLFQISDDQVDLQWLIVTKQFFMREGGRLHMCTTYSLSAVQSDV